MTQFKLCPPRLLLPLTLITLLTTTTAQTRPDTVREAIAVTLEEKMLYIVAGYNSTEYSSRLWTLDLTIPAWSTSEPPWRARPDMPVELFMEGQFGSLYRSNSELVVGSGGGYMVTYSLASNTWGQVGTLPGNFATMEGVMAVTDPVMDRIVIPSGFRNKSDVGPSALRSGALFLDVNTMASTVGRGLETASTDKVVIPKDLYGYSALWSTERKSTLVFGGKGWNQSGLNDELLELAPGGIQWSIVNTSGDKPGGRTGMCLVPAHKGKTLVLFGGQVGKGTPTSIHTLNLTTLVWTKGQDVDLELARRKHVCTSAGDSFVAWGGENRDGVMLPTFSTPIVYDLRKGEWAKRFALDSNQAVAMDPPALPPTLGQTGPFGPSAGTIAGGVIGGLALALALGFFVYWRQNTSAKKRKDQKWDPLLKDFSPMEAEIFKSDRKHSFMTILGRRDPEFYPNRQGRNDGRGPQTLLERDQEHDQDVCFSPLKSGPLSPHALLVHPDPLEQARYPPPPTSLPPPPPPVELVSVSLAHEIQMTRSKLVDLLALEASLQREQQ